MADTTIEWSEKVWNPVRGCTPVSPGCANCYAMGPLPNVHLGVSVEDRKHGLPRIEHLRKVPAAVRWLSIEPLLEDLGAVDLTGISWVVVGAESGHGARPFFEDWVRSLRDQCAAQGVAFFYKQRLDAKGRKISLPMLDGVRHAAMPEVPRV